MRAWFPRAAPRIHKFITVAGVHITGGVWDVTGAKCVVVNKFHHRSLNPPPPPSSSSSSPSSVPHFLCVRSPNPRTR